MKIEDVACVTLTMDDSARMAVPMLAGEIAGATVYHHVMLQNDSVQFLPDNSMLRILFLCQGEVSFTVDGKKYAYDEKAVFAAAPEQTVDLWAAADARILEIQWKLTERDRKELDASETVFPVTSRYEDAVQYRDPFKSEKTISRAIIPQRVLPRFAMGSVETYGDDLIGQHAHPLLDQFFFTFPENDMDLLLDDISYPVKGDTLLHIPLGSNHGVRVNENQCAHYIWIDFIICEEGLDYLDETHKETGVQRSFRKG